MLKQHDYIPENEGSVWTENSGVSLLRKKGVYLDRRSGVSYAGISNLLSNDRILLILSYLKQRFDELYNVVKSKDDKEDSK